MKVERRHAFWVWLVGTLLAIAVIGTAPLLGLALALLSGVAFGVMNWLIFAGARRKSDLTGGDRLT